MNHLVFLNTSAGELEKILSGTKTMLVKELDPAQTAAGTASPGDSLYFLRDNGECAVRVKATVVCVRRWNRSDQDLPHTLKEMQPKLQLTEDQFNTWSARKQVLLVEFESAHKIEVLQVAAGMIAHRSDWIPFEEYDAITQKEDKKIQDAVGS